MPKVIKGAIAEWGACSRTVVLGRGIWALSYWDNTIAVGSESRDIIILDAVTGSNIAIFSGHAAKVNCVTFSLDGKSLISGSDDKTVKLWDVQTGGFAKTFHGHTSLVLSVSISADCTRIVSGSLDCTIYFWDVQRGECLHTIQQEDVVEHVIFSSMDPYHLISVSGGKVWQWDVNGHQIPPIYDGIHIAFSPDYAQFALCNGNAVTVQNSNSRAVTAKFHVTNGDVRHCCFSPDGRLVAAATKNRAYVWDIGTSSPYLIENFFCHDWGIRSLMFSSPSSLISASRDGTVKFWKVGVLSTDPAATDPEFTPLTLPSIQSVSLQARAGIAISIDEEGVVKTWDISTGLCKGSFQTPATEPWKDAQLIDGRVVIVWYQDMKIYIWETNKDKLLQTIDMPSSQIKGLRISGDRSKVFYLTEESIYAWSMSTGEPMGRVKLELEQNLYLDPLHMDGSRIWIRTEDFSVQGWDFGVSGFPPVPLSIRSIERPLLDFISGASWQTSNPSWIKDITTGKEIFKFSGRYAEAECIQWDGKYLVIGYGFGEVLVFDFCHMYPQ